jgi:hypothetical protein
MKPWNATTLEGIYGGAFWFCFEEVRVTTNNARLQMVRCYNTLNPSIPINSISGIE